MKALDRLKMDINEYNETIAPDMEYLFLKIRDLYKNYSKMDLNEIIITIEAMYDEINQIEKETAVLRKMEEYYVLFKQEQDRDKEFNFLERNRTQPKREVYRNTKTVLMQKK